MRPLVATLVVAASAAGALAQDVPAVTVPFKLLPSRHMLVELTVNGKGPFKVIFDTGAPLNLVNGKLAKAAGIGTGGGFSWFGGIDTVEVETAKLGGVTLKKLPVIVMDHPTVRALSDTFAADYGRIDGIVGFPLFARYKTTVDYQRRELTLTPTGYKPGDYIKDLTEALTTATEATGPKVVAPAGVWGFAVAAADGGAAGVTVQTVAAGGPAARAGLKPGDRLLTLDGRWTDTVTDAYLATSLVKPGRPAELVVKRGDATVKLMCTPVNGY